MTGDVKRVVDEETVHVSDNVSVIWKTHEYRNKIVFILTFSICAVLFVLGVYGVLSYLPLPLVGVLIAVFVAIGGAYSYMKSRLDKLIAQLDEARIWLYYPSLRTKPHTATYTHEDLQEIAKRTVDKLTEARAAMAAHLDNGFLPLVINEKKENGGCH